MRRLMKLIAVYSYIMKLLNSGEFGIVYKGYLVEQYTNEIVAVKTLKGELSMIIKSMLPIESLHSSTRTY